MRVLVEGGELLQNEMRLIQLKVVPALLKLAALRRFATRKVLLATVGGGLSYPARFAWKGPFLL